MNISQIDQDTHFLCGSTSATYSPTNMRRNQMIAYQDVAQLIWQSDNGWHYDDSNNTDGPVAYKTLGNLSGSYTVPTSAIRIESVEIKDNNGTWNKLKPRSLHEFTISPETYITGGGLPIEYMLEGNEIRLFPSPITQNVTMSSGMAVRLSRAVTEFPVSATTSIPGFASPFHRILSYAAAIDFTQDNIQRQFLLQQRARLENGLIRFYARRADEFPTQIKPHSKNRWQQYI